MTMLCPRCQVAYQDGQICPSCRGYLVPYQPQMQSPAPQPTYEYAPEAAYEAAGAPVAAASPSKGKTVAIAVLSVLVALLTASCVVLLMRPAPEPEVVEKIVEVEPEHPTEAEQAVADLGWSYASRIYGLLSDMGAMGSATDPATAFGNVMAAGIVLADQGYRTQVDDAMKSLSDYPEAQAAWGELPEASSATGSETGEMTPEQYQQAMEGCKAFLESYRRAAASEGFDTAGWVTE